MAGYAILAIAGSLAAQEFHPDIRRAWDDKAVAGFEMPLAQREGSRRDMTSDEYYKLESLKQKEPETPGGNAVSAAAIFRRLQTLRIQTGEPNRTTICQCQDSFYYSHTLDFPRQASARAAIVHHEQQNVLSFPLIAL